MTGKRKVKEVIFIHSGLGNQMFQYAFIRLKQCQAVMLFTTQCYVEYINSIMVMNYRGYSILMRLTLYTILSYFALSKKSVVT